jgi:hypothetical protein
LGKTETTLFHNPSGILVMVCLCGLRIDATIQNERGNKL